MNLLVTGATGFVGSYVLRQLIVNRPDITLFAIRRTSSPKSLVADIEDRINWIEAGLEDFFILDEVVSDMNVIIHCAARVSLRKSDQNALIKTNVYGTRDLVNLALHHGISKFIYISSVTALGKGKGENLIDETANWYDEPIHSGYAKSKYLGGLEVKRARAEGLNTSIVYPSHVFGAGYWDKGPSEILKRIYNGLSFYPSGSNGLVDVRDLGLMITLLIETWKNSPNEIICSNVNVSHYDLFKDIAMGLDRPLPVRNLGGWYGFVAKLGARLASMIGGGSETFTPQAIKLANTNFSYDNARSKSLEGFSYTPVRQTIEETCQSFLSTHSKGMNYGILHVK